MRFAVTIEVSTPVIGKLKLLVPAFFGLVLLNAPSSESSLISSQSLSSPEYSFRGLALGMSLAGLRALSPFDPPAKLICNDSAGSRSDLPSDLSYETNLTEKEEAAGLVKCTYYSHGDRLSFGSYALSSITVFLEKDSQKDDAVLYKILAESPAYYDSFLQGLQDKLGKPDTEYEDVASWHDGTKRASIAKIPNFPSAGTIRIELDEDALSRKVEERERSYRAPPSPAAPL